MILARELHLAFGTQEVFRKISFSIKGGQKIGLVGPNGAGKSTLLKVIAGFQKLDDGEIAIQKGMDVAYMPQEMVLSSKKKCVDEVMTAYARVEELEHLILQLEAKIDAGTSTPQDLEKYSHALSDIQEYDVEKLRVEARKILQGLGFSEERIEQHVSELSVGWKMRVVLAKLLLQKSDIYLFDEPTNHLDIVAKEWFVQFLKNTESGFLLVSHDRYFLDTVCDQILELEYGNASFFNGNYTSYMKQKEETQELLEQKALTQAKDIKRRTETARRFAAKATKAKMAKSMLKAIEREEKIVVATRNKRAIGFSFGTVERAGKVVLALEDVAVGYNDVSILKGISFEIQRGEKVALVAANGVGKTTLFKAITGALIPQHGRISFGYKVTPMIFEQDQNEVLDMGNTILNEVEDSCTTSEARAKVRSMLGAFLFPGDDVKKRISVLSGGEKNRVAMVKVLLQDANLLLLDEPTNHLDIQSKEILLEALKAYQGTILFVSHDRLFLEELATRVIELTPTKAYSYPGSYEGYMYQKKHEESLSAPQARAHAKKGVAQNKNKPGLSYDDRKKVRSLEAKIEKKERELDRIRDSFADLVFGTPQYDTMLAKMNALETEIKRLYADWEVLHEE